MRLVLIAALSLTAATIGAEPVTVLNGGQPVSIEQTLPDDNDLWVTPADLPRVNGFTLKPEGACLGDFCVPIDQSADSTMYVTRDGQGWVNVSALSKKLGQAFMRDPEARVWSFGPLPAQETAFVESGLAPDFELSDRGGVKVHLSDFRGRKVLLVTWASWCGCRNDLAGWQKVYSELRDKGLEIISVAEDAGGEDAAGPWFDAAQATFTQLIDENHLVSRLYNMTNVPTGVWIDEQGRIVRPNEPAYSRDIALRIGGKDLQVNGSAYVAALRDWVAQGEQSAFAMKSQQIKTHLAKRSPSQATAEAAFQLGKYFHRTGDAARAARYWSRAQALRPQDWNYHRQAWAFTPAEAGPKWMTKFLELGDAPYYPPLELSRGN